MKIKHYQGYGTLNAFVMLRTQTYGPKGYTNRSVKIEVIGNHEYGLELRYKDNYALAQWLGRLGKFTEKEVVSFEMESFYKRNEEKRIDEEHCIYSIFLTDIRNEGVR